MGAAGAGAGGGPWIEHPVAKAVSAIHRQKLTQMWVLRRKAPIPPSGKGVNSFPKGCTMWMLLLEAGIALSLFIFIMWWTLGPVSRRENRERMELGKADPPALPEERDS